MPSESTNPDPDDLHRRLEEAEDTLRAIRMGEVDALVVDDAGGRRLYTLQGADHPYRAMIQAMQQGAVSLSGDGTVLYCNQSFANMVGRPHETVIGAAVTDFLAPAYRGLLAAMLTHARNHNAHGELALLSTGGTNRPVMVALNPLVLTDAVTICMIVTDLSEEKKHQDLQDADRRKDEFLATLAHELRNPLAPISNSLEIMKHANGDADLVELARSTMSRQIAQMVRLVDDLLDMSRITRDKLELRKERAELAPIIENAVEACRPLCERSQHQLEIKMPSEPIFLDADSVRLAQVFGNLLNNACKYTPRGGHISLTVQRLGADVQVSIKDNGVGIPHDMLAKIFDMFTQVDRSLEGSLGGLGIGLTLARRLVVMHRGTIIASSDGAGKGSEFVVSLSIARQIENIEKMPVHTDLPRERTSRRILVVDDNRDSAVSLSILLRRSGHEAQTAGDGLEAIEKAAEYKPQVILLDIGLPTINGYDVCRAIRKTPLGQNIVMIALTGWGQEDDRRKSREAGFDAHLVKPIEINQVLDLIAPPRIG